jgi:hypothetical protein
MNNNNKNKETKKEYPHTVDREKVDKITLKPKKTPKDVSK